jgi:FlaG/FlaF family flagellin (archaellin)
MPLPPIKSQALAGKRSIRIAVVMAGFVVLILAAGVAIWTLKTGHLKQAPEPQSATATPATPAAPAHGLAAK